MTPAAGAPLHRKDIVANQSLMSKWEIVKAKNNILYIHSSQKSPWKWNEIWEMKWSNHGRSFVEDETDSLEWMRGSFKKSHQKRNRFLEWTFTDETFLLGSDKEVDNNIKYSTYQSEWFIQPLNRYHTLRHVGDVITWTVNIDYLTSLIYSDVQ